MTETSPTSFITQPTDSLKQRLETVGRVFPQVSAKVVDSNHCTVPRGVRGELCISGWLLQKGYFGNPEATAKAMIADEDGVLWMHTGDEAVIDEEGYCTITGRIKDIIIRGESRSTCREPYAASCRVACLVGPLLINLPGGENIYPGEIEERLLEHPSIAQAAVVGIRDHRYGEVVAAFVATRPGAGKLSLDDARQWVQDRLGRHKAPAYIFWVGPTESVAEFPLTGNGKYRKDLLRNVGDRMVAEGGQRAPSKL
jgi:mevalonyl-CoA ligase